MKITQFKNIKQTEGGIETSIDEFVTRVKLGEWQKKILAIRKETNVAYKAELKKRLPYVTISGTFSKRKEAGLIEHSGFICMDFDNIGPNEMQEALEHINADIYTHASFKSSSGNGFAVIVKIDPKKHKDSFLGLESYYINTYLLAADKACKDVSRARYASDDPDAFISSKSKVFKQYLSKKHKTKVTPVIFQNSDIIDTVTQIVDNEIDVTNGMYERWLHIGFGLADELGESGRELFHKISEFNNKYKESNCDKQFDYCLKAQSTGVTISTFFYYAREAGVQAISPTTKLIVAQAKISKRQGRDSSSAMDVLHQIEGIDPKVSAPVIAQVYKSNIDLRGDHDLTQTEQTEIFIKNNFGFKRNEITNQIEEGGKEVDEIRLNSIWVELRKVVSEKITYNVFERIFLSDLIDTYNPIHTFIDSNLNYNKSGYIKELSECISTTSGLDVGFDPKDEHTHDYVEKFLTAWLVGMIASVYGNHSPLLLVLVGEKQNTGKTEFFRRLLPKSLRTPVDYFADSQLDAGKDDAILMCQKLIILDDEFGGKSKVDLKKLKNITSKDYFTVRPPYGRKSITMRRMASLCGTSNDRGILNDPTGNRRIIPIYVDSIDHDKYNKIDKTALFMEAVALYKSGYHWQLKKDDIDLLARNTHDFEQVVLERELIQQFFIVPDEKGPGLGIEKMTTTEIKIYIENTTQQKCSVIKLGQELKRLKFQKHTDNQDENKSKKWQVVRVKGVAVPVQMVMSN